VIGTRISRLLLPSDWGVFRDATRRLQKDDSHTFEVRFRLQVEPEEDRELSPSGVLYQQMEGQGMLMIDRELGQPSHTMWVVKPISVPHYEYPSPSIMQDPNVDPGFESASVKPKFEDNADPSAALPFCHPISTENILCRICECQIPQWYFEKHSETCVEVHRLEAEIMECNESITELRNTIRDLCINMDRSSPVVTPEYRGMPIFSPSTSPNVPSPLQLFRSSKLQRMGVKRLQRLLLEQLEDILLVALEVAIPSLKEEESNEPIERQRLLSPSSERKMSQIRNWSKPNTEDAALAQLCEDAERVMRQKIDNVVRMQNTIRYMEKIWHEWESKVNAYLADLRDSDSAEEGGEEVPVGSEGDHSSTTSEYAFQGETPSTADPTPVGRASPAMSAVNDPFVAQSTPDNTVVMAPTPAVPPAQVVWHTMSTMQIQQTRSSTPSSLSSPLAYAAPIVARSPGDTPPPMSLDDPHIPGTVKPRKSSGNLLEPRVMVTPPLSPLMSPKDGAMVRKDRRHSTANPSISPIIPSSSGSGSGPGPLSPRHSTTIPAPRSSPTSIKDFDIIKPISKGAFGSVFLAKKKATGDYYAVKVLKKADMIAKNQITNVKAERMILMKQAESPFVAKLYFTFQSKENLYLVMEYLNGGDCAALIKSLGSLPEEWTKNYIAEVTLGLEYLHERGVVHRYISSSLVCL
jgi:serine/threonine-protein kinase RIM15